MRQYNGPRVAGFTSVYVVFVGCAAKVGRPVSRCVVGWVVLLCGLPISSVLGFVAA
jgi:hypothetical protein